MSSRVQTSNWPLPANGLRFVTPPRLRRTLAAHALTRGCYPLAMGFYPEAYGHQMQRAQPDDYLLIYCRAGGGWLDIGDGRLAVGGGDLLLLPKGLAHAYGADPQRPWTLYWVHFAGELVSEFLRPLGAAPMLSIGLQPRLLAEFDSLLNLRRQGLSLPHFIHAAQQLQSLLSGLAVLTALGDAERALGDYHGGLDTLERRGMALDAARTSYGHAKARYAAGDIALVELLAAQRSLHEAETAAARAHTNAAVQLVALYKALGGGWDVSTTASTATHPLRGAAAPVAFSSR